MSFCERQAVRGQPVERVQAAGGGIAGTHCVTEASQEDSSGAVLALLVLACADSALAWADSDASMILHRNVYAVRDGVVVDVWEMDGSIGRMQ